MGASRSAQTSTSGLGSRARVDARARNRLRAPIEGGFVRSRYARASDASVTAALDLLDERRHALHGEEELERPWGRRIGAGIGAVALSAVTGLFVAGIVAASMFGLIVVLLNAHR